MSEDLSQGYPLKKKVESDNSTLQTPSLDTLDSIRRSMVLMIRNEFRAIPTIVRSIVREEMNLRQTDTDSSLRSVSLINFGGYPLYPPQLDFSEEAGFQVDASKKALEEKFQMLEEKVKRFESSLNKPEQKNVKIQEGIVTYNRDFLVREYKGNFVAITYEGKVVGSSENKVDLMKKIKYLNVPTDQLFIYAVPLK